MKDDYGEMCNIHDIETADDAYRWLATFSVFALKNHNVYTVESWSRTRGFRLRNVDTNIVTSISSRDCLSNLRGDTDGLDIFQDKLPEYFV